VGFVSVFAWEPEAVVVHTGRVGEAWELVFYPDRRFEKLRLQEPVEGTTVALLRRGRASERAAIAEAVRDSLWRWCRYCRLELSFEDVASGEAPELIQDSPAPADSPLTVSETQAETTVHVAFAVPPSAVLLRRGLVLAEGGAADLLGPLLPGLRADHGAPAGVDRLAAAADDDRPRQGGGRRGAARGAGAGGRGGDERCATRLVAAIERRR
jgi:hypothetical protein